MAAPKASHEADDGAAPFEIVDVALEFRCVSRVNAGGRARFLRADGDEAMCRVAVRIPNCVPSAVTAAGM